ncbi:transcriptional repressor CTCF [Eurytemora carolleeae]|uniref:transcriptional repressor CTCF n=1 Tax=Eurytemora carolleeae TaxID=1294199 RepID=UPI000C76470D|nr:transcriptional repressor CTCF [Eurytemora carolleeae]|eukprot:XP_023329055.1 transcriptional repressor CTCF-like [Eurytemora affinis]
MGDPEPESIGDIQNYLEHFNPKEVGGVVISKTEVMDATSSVNLGSVDATGTGQYFVDQTTGQYYYQSAADEPFTMVQTDEAMEDSPPTIDRAEAASPPSIVQEGLTSNQVVLNDGDNQFQTVTIVPNNSSSGEVSYVLIVQPNQKKEDGEAEAVYDFDTEDPAELEEDLSLEAKERKPAFRRPPPVQALSCSYCNYTTSKRYLLSRHLKCHSDERPHKCSVCERGFKTLASLQNHVNTHTGTKPHRCKFCQATFTTSGELVRHVRYKHTHEKPHRCTECEYECVEYSKLKRHMRCHTGERPYQCPNCTYASPDTFKLKRHLRIHTGEKPYECDICHAKFTQSNSLKAHKAIHTGEKPVYQCELCPTTCGRKTDLRLHVQKLHTSEKPMQCKNCDKSFPDRYTLKVHKKSHEGEKCFKCDLCPYSSISQRHLESHMLIHTDQKPYRCDQCDQSFRQKQLLKRHQNLYHNPAYIPPLPREKTHECIECNRVFRHKGNLMRHMALHDPESSVQEKALALKFGRQKKYQMIDGQQVEVMANDNGSDEEDEEEEGEEEDESGMTVEGPDGQYYVVLDVTQLEVQAQDDVRSVQVVQDNQVQQVLIQETQILSDSGDGNKRIVLSPILEDTLEESLMPQDEIRIKKQERESCFGFDEDDEDD